MPAGKSSTPADATQDDILIDLTDMADDTDGLAEHNALNGEGDDDQAVLDLAGFMEELETGAEDDILDLGSADMVAQEADVLDLPDGMTTSEEVLDLGPDMTADTQDEGVLDLTADLVEAPESPVEQPEPAMAEEPAAPGDEADDLDMASLDALLEGIEEGQEDSIAGEETDGTVLGAALDAADDDDLDALLAGDDDLEQELLDSDIADADLAAPDDGDASDLAELNGLDELDDDLDAELSGVLEDLDSADDDTGDTAEPAIVPQSEDMDALLLDDDTDDLLLEDTAEDGFADSEPAADVDNDLDDELSDVLEGIGGAEDAMSRAAVPESDDVDALLLGDDADDLLAESTSEEDGFAAPEEMQADPAEDLADPADLGAEPFPEDIGLSGEDTLEEELSTDSAISEADLEEDIFGPLEVPAAAPEELSAPGEPDVLDSVDAAVEQEELPEAAELQPEDLASMADLDEPVGDDALGADQLERELEAEAVGVVDSVLESLQEEPVDADADADAAAVPLPDAVPDFTATAVPQPGATLPVWSAEEQEPEAAAPAAGPQESSEGTVERLDELTSALEAAKVSLRQQDARLQSLENFVGAFSSDDALAENLDEVLGDRLKAALAQSLEPELTALMAPQAMDTQALAAEVSGELQKSLGRNLRAELGNQLMDRLQDLENKLMDKVQTLVDSRVDSMQPKAAPQPLIAPPSAGGVDLDGLREQLRAEVLAELQTEVEARLAEVRAELTKELETGLETKVEALLSDLLPQALAQALPDMLRNHAGILKLELEEELKAELTASLEQAAAQSAAKVIREELDMLLGEDLSELQLED